MLPLSGRGGLAIHSGIPKQRIGHDFGSVNGLGSLKDGKDGKNGKETEYGKSAKDVDLSQPDR
jgi:hypothetical protein